MFSEEQIHRNTSVMEHFDHCAGGDRRLQLPQYFLSNSTFHSAHNSVIDFNLFIFHCSFCLISSCSPCCIKSQSAALKVSWGKSCKLNCLIWNNIMNIVDSQTNFDIYEQHLHRVLPLCFSGPRSASERFLPKDCGYVIS